MKVNTKNYNSITETIKSGRIGDPKCVRVYKTSGVDGVALDEAIRCELYEDIKFILSSLGEPEQIYAKSAGLENIIVMIKHKNKKMSHLALNLFNEPVLPTFRVEVAGDKGLIDYDSDKSIPVFFNKKLVLSKTDYSYEKRLLEDEGDLNALSLISEIMSKINGGVK